MLIRIRFFCFEYNRSKTKGKLVLHCFAPPKSLLSKVIKQFESEKLKRECNFLVGEKVRLRSWIVLMQIYINKRHDKESLYFSWYRLELSLGSIGRQRQCAIVSISSSGQ
ncbi:unnamed protein product [Coffea canephora]|uniref:Uncharacterized protein n=1 Tax=Coffea canephora TaxID=49390 RepID=A0A068UPA7_COFCA|nr:unnamed protein product [Coffea canephora]CDP11875.1 unnamed protein product [Coffea canephora]